MKILGIESSCDETAAAIVEDGKRLISSVVNSQIDIHAEYGGVIPEIAARSHLEVVNPVIRTALEEANCDWEEEHGLMLVWRNGTTLTKVGGYDGHLTNVNAYANKKMINVVYAASNPEYTTFLNSN